MPEQPLNPCEHDFDAIEAAVMETSRGRWFLAEYQRRNRSADTKLVLSALSKIDGKIVSAPLPAAELDTAYQNGISEINGAIETLHRDLAFLQKRGACSITGNASSLTALVELDNGGSGKLSGAIEALREVSWTMREVGTNPEFCNTIDAMTAEISRACGVDDAATTRVSKLVGTIDYVQQRLNKITDDLGLPVISKASAGTASMTLAAPLTQNTLEALSLDEIVAAAPTPLSPVVSKAIAPPQISPQSIVVNSALLSLPHIREALNREWAQEATIAPAPAPAPAPLSAAPPSPVETAASFDFSSFSFEEKLALFS